MNYLSKLQSLVKHSRFGLEDKFIVPGLQCKTKHHKERKADYYKGYRKDIDQQKIIVSPWTKR